MEERQAEGGESVADRTRGARRRQLLLMLFYHGLMDAPARAVITLGQELRLRTLHTRREFAALVEADTGLQLGETISGVADEVDLGALQRRRLPGHRYVCLHTHPESMPLSVEDVAFFLEEGYVCLLTAVGRDGSWYAMSVEPGRARPDLALMRETFGKIAEETIDDFLVSEDAPPREVKAARRAHMHVIWTHAAPVLGLRYDRVQGTETNEVG